MLQVQNEDFLHTIQVITEKQYEDEQIASLKLIFSTDDDENIEKLKIMKLE